MTDEEQVIYDEVTKQKSADFFCDNCEYYPIVPVHGHFECPRCHYKSKCCEGLPQDV